MDLKLTIPVFPCIPLFLCVSASIIVFQYAFAEQVGLKHINFCVSHKLFQIL